MKTRTMLYLDNEEHQNLKMEAAKRQISMAALVRQLVRQYFEQGRTKSPTSRDALIKIVALGSSGRSDISEKHDNYLGEALRREHSR